MIDMTLKQTVFIHEISGNIYLVHYLDMGHEYLELEGEDFAINVLRTGWPLKHLIEIGDL